MTTTTEVDTAITAVRSRHPEAVARHLCGKGYSYFEIYTSMNSPIFLGVGDTEEQAWANAAIRFGGQP